MWHQPIGYGKTVERLCKKIERDCGIKCKPHTFRRTFAGSMMKSWLGYVSWTMDDDKGREVQSTEPASELLKKKYKLQAYNGGLYVEIWGEVKSDQLKAGDE